MENEILQRFDDIMPRLRQIEPSLDFDMEFKRRLAETAIEARKRFIYFNRVPAMASALAAFVIVISVSLYTYSARPSLPVMELREGIVTVLEKDGVAAKEIVLAGKLNPGDTIVTGPNSSVDIVLAGKYAMRVKDNARVRIARLTPRYGKGTALFELNDGKVLVSVEKGFRGSEFIVATKETTATALGTKFTVGVSKKNEREESSVSVFEGKVKVISDFMPKTGPVVIVSAGQRTSVLTGAAPIEPRRMAVPEWRELDEFYQIGRKPRVVLLIVNSPDRVMQLLRPCPLYISDEKPREIPMLLEEAVLKMEEAIKTSDTNKHLESISILEKMLKDHPNPKYDTQLLLYIGAYYGYIGKYEKAIETFDKVVLKYPESTFASIAQCAIGVTYEDKLHDAAKARKAYEAVLERYPNSLEAIWVEEKLGIKKLAKKI